MARLVIMPEDMKRAVLFVNGNKPSKELVFEVVRTTDTIICADGGAKHVLASGLTPHVIVGDLDSLSKQHQKKLNKFPIEWVTFSTDKDFTDSELALKHAIKKGFRDIVILGVHGDRFDHVLANITHLSRLIREKNGLSISIIEKGQKSYFVKEKIVLSGKKGQTVSILSLFGDAKGVTTTGLKWKLRNEKLYFGEPRGVSNEFTGTKATVTVANGVLFVVVQQ